GGSLRSSLLTHPSISFSNTPTAVGGSLRSSLLTRPSISFSNTPTAVGGSLRSSLLTRPSISFSNTPTAVGGSLRSSLQTRPSNSRRRTDDCSWGSLRPKPLIPAPAMSCCKRLTQRRVDQTNGAPRASRPGTRTFHTNLPQARATICTSLFSLLLVRT